MMSDQTEKLLALAGQLHNLNESDAKFATSLMDSHKRMGELTEKQMYWVGKLTERGERNASRPEPTAQAAPAAQVIRLDRLFELFDYALGHGLSQPRVRLADKLTLSLAPPGRNQGSIYLKRGRDYYGKIDRTGKAEKAISCMTADWLAALPIVEAFAADPKKAAEAYGFATNHCCFCGKPLTDEESVNRGYGPICAMKFGLVHNAMGHGKKIKLEIADA